ncbi:hypothetical protein BS78_K220700 [Paspalum vaginatum]|uniref:Uncharacterized protein n=1 Tax=Paspalum vaginatum TaxID=158149 RepID=A0A9W8CGT0_9POAL|nr:hypothetical protein BS78_K220700 [Paspalum vaginatum]
MVVAVLGPGGARHSTEDCRGSWSWLTRTQDVAQQQLEWRRKHRRVPGHNSRREVPGQNGQLPLQIGDGIPDHELVIPRDDHRVRGRTVHAVEEDAAVASAQLGDAAGTVSAEEVGVSVEGVVEEAQHGARAVQLVEPAAEGGAGDEAEPLLAHEGAVDEPRGVVRRHAEEDVFYELLHHQRRRRRHASFALIARSQVSPQKILWGCQCVSALTGYVSL